MAILFNVEGSKKVTKSLFTSVNGSKRKIIKALTSVNGIIKVIFEDGGIQKTGYLFIPYGNTTKLEFTDDNFATFTEIDIGSTTSLNQMLLVNGTVYVYSSTSYVFTSTDLDNWTQQTLTISYSNTGRPTMTTDSNCYVKYFDGLFYKFYYYRVNSSSAGYGSYYYIATSSNGHNFTTDPTVIHSYINMRYSSSTYNIYSFGFVSANGHTKLICGGLSKTGSSPATYTAYVRYADITNGTVNSVGDVATSGSIAASNYSEWTLKRWIQLDNTNAIMPYGNGANKFMYQTITINNDGTISTSRVDKRTSITYEIKAYANNKLYCFNSSKSGCVYNIANASVTQNYTLEGSNFYSFALSPDNDIIVFTGAATAPNYIIDTTTDNISTIGTSAYMPLTGYYGCGESCAYIESE